MKTSIGRIKKDIGIAFLLEFLIGINCYFAKVYTYEVIGYGLSAVLCIPLFFVLKQIALLSLSSSKKVMENVIPEIEKGFETIALPLQSEKNDLPLVKVTEHSLKHKTKSEIDEWFELHIEKVKADEKETVDELYVDSNPESVVKFEEVVSQSVENVCGEEIEALFSQHLAKLEIQAEDLDAFYVAAKQEAKVQKAVVQPVENVCQEEIDVLFSEYLSTIEEGPANTEEFFVDTKPVTQAEAIQVESVENICEEEIDALFNEYLIEIEKMPEDMKAFYVDVKRENVVASEVLDVASIENIHGEEIEAMFKKHIQEEKMKPKCYEQYAYCV